MTATGQGPSPLGPPPSETGGGGKGMGDQVQEGVDKAKEVAGQATAQLADKAQELGSQVQDQAREQIDSRSTQVGEQVTATASAVRDASQQLREQGQDLPARLIEQAADKAEQLGSYLRGASADKLVHDIEQVTRSQPWVVIAGGITAGFLGARFLKASSRSRYQSRTAVPSRPATSLVGGGASRLPEAMLAGTPTPSPMREPLAPASEPIGAS